MVDRMHNVFVSTTDSKASTRSFSGAGIEDENEGTALRYGLSWQLCLVVDSNVNVVEVGKHLPDGWLCYPASASSSSRPARSTA